MSLAAIATEAFDAADINKDHVLEPREMKHVAQILLEEGLIVNALQEIVDWTSLKRDEKNDLIEQVTADSFFALGIKYDQNDPSYCKISETQFKAYLNRLVAAAIEAGKNRQDVLAALAKMPEQLKWALTASTATEGAFSAQDRGKHVKIQRDGTVTVNGHPQNVTWGEAKPQSCEGVIAFVEERLKGQVQLQNGQTFENPGPGRHPASDEIYHDLMQTHVTLDNPGFADEVKSALLVPLMKAQLIKGPGDPAWLALDAHSAARMLADASMNFMVARDPKLQTPLRHAQDIVDGDAAREAEAAIRLVADFRVEQELGRKPAIAGWRILSHDGIDGPTRPQTGADALKGAFSNADKGRHVKIYGNGTVTLDGMLRNVVWGDATPPSCEGAIAHVEDRRKGQVELQNGQKFENPSSVRYEILEPIIKQAQQARGTFVAKTEAYADGSNWIIDEQKRRRQLQHMLEKERVLLQRTGNLSAISHLQDKKDEITRDHERRTLSGENRRMERDISMAAAAAKKSGKQGIKSIWMTWYTGQQGEAVTLVLVTVLLLINTIACIKSVQDNESTLSLFSTLDTVMVVLLGVEILINLVAFSPKRFIRWKWFCVDTACFVLGAAAHAGWGYMGFASFRALRLLHSVGVFFKDSSIETTLQGISKSTPSVVAILAILLLIVGTYAIMGVEAYREIEPELFGDLSNSTFTLFQVMTMENWADGVARKIGDRYKRDDKLFSSILAYVYFVSFLIISAFMVLNVIIAIIIQRVQEAFEGSRSAAHRNLILRRVMKDVESDLDLVETEFEYLQNATAGLDSILQVYSKTTRGGMQMVTKFKDLERVLHNEVEYAQEHHNEDLDIHEATWEQRFRRKATIQIQRLWRARKMQRKAQEEIEQKIAAEKIAAERAEAEYRAERAEAEYRAQLDEDAASRELALPAHADNLMSDGTTFAGENTYHDLDRLSELSAHDAPPSPQDPRSRPHVKRGSPTHPSEYGHGHAEVMVPVDEEHQQMQAARHHFDAGYFAKPLSDWGSASSSEVSRGPRTLDDFGKPSKKEAATKEAAPTIDETVRMDDPLMALMFDPGFQQNRSILI